MNSIRFRRYGILGAACLCLMIGSASSAEDTQKGRRVINVKTVSQLYAAVNDSANRNVTVRLAPGTYLLSSFRSNGAPRRNQGALRMPPGMSLVGSEKRVDTNGDGVPDPVSDATPDDFTVPGTETIIDGSALELPPELRADCADEFFLAPSPVIQVGVNNSISRLTLYAGNNVGISEPTNSPVDPNGNLSMSVTNTVLEGSSLLMGFSNSECAARRARSVLTFSHNVVRGTVFIGVLIQNFLTGDASNDGSDGPTIWATIDFQSLLQQQQGAHYIWRRPRHRWRLGDARYERKRVQEQRGESTGLRRWVGVECTVSGDRKPAQCEIGERYVR